MTVASATSGETSGSTVASGGTLSFSTAFSNRSIKRSKSPSSIGGPEYS